MSKNKPFNPSIESGEDSWTLSRSKFLKTLVLSGVALQMPWLQSCSVDEVIDDTNPLTLKQYKTIRSVQDILFPEDGNGPGAREINATEYLCWVLRDPLLDPNEGTYIIERIDKLDELAVKEKGDSFFNLYESDQLDLIERISSESWGKKWLSRLLTLIFEALLLDPVYGGNVKGASWEWLKHDPGLPRPTKELIYPEIFKKL